MSRWLYNEYQNIIPVELNNIKEVITQLNLKLI